MSTQRTSTSATKRASVAPSLPLLPKPPLSIDPTAVIAEKASIDGKHLVKIGKDVVVHPFAKIVSTQCGLTIGDGCILWERSTVGLEASSDSTAAEKKESGAGQSGIRLQRNVVVEGGALVEAAEVGEGTIIEVNARIGAGAIIGKYCKITPLSVIGPHEAVPDYTVVFGNNQLRTNHTLKDYVLVQQLHENSHMKHIELLRKLVASNLAKWQ